MISIEKVSNGFIVRIEEADEDSTVVFQKEYESLNVALGSVCQSLLNRWQDDDEPIKVNLDVGPR